MATIRWVCCDFRYRFSEVISEFQTSREISKEYGYGSRVTRGKTGGKKVKESS